MFPSTTSTSTAPVSSTSTSTQSQLTIITLAAADFAKEAPLLFSGKHIVMVGDSLMRYQYLNLAYSLAHHRSPDFEFHESEFLKSSASYGKTNTTYAFRWKDWYMKTNAALRTEEAAEFCDCYRTQCSLAGVCDGYENRYFAMPSAGVHFCYVCYYWTDKSFFWRKQPYFLMKNDYNAIRYYIFPNEPIIFSN